MPPLETLQRFSDVETLIQALPLTDEKAEAAARERQLQLTKPPGSLGRLEGIACFFAGWSGNDRPEIISAQALVFAGNHGICDQGVNPFPQEVTAQMVANFQAGGAAINQLCHVAGADLNVVPIDLEVPTKDFTHSPAMSEAECMDAIRRGANAVDASADILLLGEMGIGNSTIAAALCHAIFGGTASDWVGRGTGSDAASIARKASVVEIGVARHRGKSPLETLAALGGREQAAICGAVIAARLKRIPVVLDGYICTAAVAPLFALQPRVLDHCLIAHLSAEPGHARLLERYGKVPILNLGLCLGEGTGAALALSIIRGSLACHSGMATFEEASVANAG